MGIVLAAAAVVGTLAALLTVWLTSRMLPKMDESSALTKAAQDDARHAHAESVRQAAELLEHTRQAHEAEMAERRRALEEEQRLARYRQIETVSALLGEISRILDEERSLRPDGKLTQINLPTRLPAGRARLDSAVSTLMLLGGPSLPQSVRVAQGSEFVHEDSLRSAVYTAQAEIASLLNGEVSTEVAPGGRLAANSSL